MRYNIDPLTCKPLKIHICLQRIISNFVYFSIYKFNLTNNYVTNSNFIMVDIENFILFSFSYSSYHESKSFLSRMNTLSHVKQFTFSTWFNNRNNEQKFQSHFYSVFFITCSLQKIIQSQFFMLNSMIHDSFICFIIL